MPSPDRHVVLMGAPLTQRHHLARALQDVMQRLEQPCILHCPAFPLELAALPPHAQHLLWNPLGSLPLEDWRGELQKSKRSFQVLHGEDSEALKQCIYALLPPYLAQDWARQPPLPRWTGVCETCGDADCEQRLFSRLWKD